MTDSAPKVVATEDKVSVLLADGVPDRRARVAVSIGLAGLGVLFSTATAFADCRPAGPAGVSQAASPFAEILPSGSAYYYSRDAQGSTRALTDSSGTKQDTWTFGPYGGLSASSGAVQNNLLFQGEYLDSESSLYYLRARYYDPTTAQF